MKKSIIDRIYLKLLWIYTARHFYWSHKPLCDRFGENIIKLGRYRFCRSCSLLYMGLVASAMAFAYIDKAITVKSCLLIALPIIALSLPKIYKKHSRGVRDLLRFGSGYILPLPIFLMISGSLIHALAILIALSAIWKYYFVVRKSRKLAECDGCAELECNKICSGFQLHREAMNIYDEKAVAYITRHKPFPQHYK